jgi:hypothetical protein
MRSISSPELPAGERIDAGRRLVKDQKVRIVNQRAAETEFLLHPPDSLPAGRSLNRTRSVLVRRSSIRHSRSSRDCPKSLPKNRRFRIWKGLDKGFSKALGKIGHSGGDGVAKSRIRDVAAQDFDSARLDLADTGQHAQKR